MMFSKDSSGFAVEDPHGLCGVDRGAAAQGDDPVGLELAHGLGALHHRGDGRIGLDALEELDLKTGVLEVLLDVLKEAAATHGAATRDDDGLAALEVLGLVAGALSKVQVTRVGKRPITPPFRMPSPPMDCKQEASPCFWQSWKSLT